MDELRVFEFNQVDVVDSREVASLKQSDSRSRRKKGAKTQPQGLREKTIWKRVST